MTGAICTLQAVRPEKRFAGVAEGMLFWRGLVINKEQLCDVWCRLTVV